MMRHPAKVGPYEIGPLLGTGGMASVYLARARKLGGFERLVAIKLLHTHLRGDPELVATLMDEARLASRLRHPNAVGVVDVGECEAGVFLALEYVEGESLAGLIKRVAADKRELSDAIALRIAEGALLGLGAAHDLRDADGEPLELVHRDFTPHNILVGVDGSVKLTDFGIAKVVRAAERRTQTGMVKGKTSYLSPEQARAQPVDRRSDVWAAGVVIWEILAGRRLFVAEDEVASLLQIVNDPIPPLAKARPDLPPEVCRVVHKALERDVGERWQTASELRTALLAACETAGLSPANGEAVGAWVREVAAVALSTRETMAVTAPTRSLSPDASQADTRSTASVPARKRAAHEGRRPYLFAAGGLALGLAASALFVTRSRPEVTPYAQAAIESSAASAEVRTAAATHAEPTAPVPDSPALPSSTTSASAAQSSPRALVARPGKPTTSTKPAPEPPKGPAPLTQSPYGK